MLEVSRVAGMLTADGSGMRHLLAPTSFRLLLRSGSLKRGCWAGPQRSHATSASPSLDGLRQASLASVPPSLEWERIRTPLGARPGPPVGGASEHESDLGWVRGTGNGGAADRSVLLLPGARMVKGLNKWKVNEGRKEGVRGTLATPSPGPLGASSLPEGGGCVDPPRGDPGRAGCPDSPRAGLVLGVARSTLTLTPGEGKVVGGKPRPPGCPAHPDCPAHLTSEVLVLLAPSMCPAVLQRRKVSLGEGR